MEKCKNHPLKNAFSLCKSCHCYFCEDCLNEGLTYYYCNNPDCYKKYLDELRYLENPQFCLKCLQETDSDTIGNLQTINFVGTSYVPVGGICDICGSYIVQKAFVIMGMPIVRYKDSYRIIKLKSKESFFSGRVETFISRKIK